MQPEAQPVLFPEAEYPTIPDYIQAEVFLETVGFFTPSSRRIKHHLVKEKTLAKRANPDGTMYEIKRLSGNSGRQFQRVCSHVSVMEFRSAV